jgi:hypothetical protein
LRQGFTGVERTSGDGKQQEQNRFFHRVQTSYYAEWRRAK